MAHENLSTTQNTKGESRWWKDLSKVCANGEDKDWFEEKITWKVRSRNRILF